MNKLYKIGGNTINLKKCVVIKMKIIQGYIFHTHHRGLIKRFIFILFFIIAYILFLTSCHTDPGKTALNSTDASKGLEALNLLNDQLKLEEVALKATNDTVRAYAIKRITNDSVLEELFLTEAKSAMVFNTAFQYISDQVFLERIALDTDFWYQLSDNGEAKKNKGLNTISILENLAMHRNTSNIRYSALNRLSDTSVALIRKASADIPAEHRMRLINAILPAIRVLHYPEVVDKTGEVASVSLSWSPMKESYSLKMSDNNFLSDPYYLDGERISCSIKLRNPPYYLAHSWSTEFPSYFRDKEYYRIGELAKAKINPYDLVGPVLEHLSESMIVRIAVKSENVEINDAIIGKLDNQVLIGKIAIENPNPGVRQHAIWNITDQIVLAEIALNEKDSILRVDAIRRITDQQLLSKIAADDSSVWVRKEALSQIDFNNRDKSR